MAKAKLVSTYDGGLEMSVHSYKIEPGQIGWHGQTRLTNLFDYSVYLDKNGKLYDGPHLDANEISWDEDNVLVHDFLIDRQCE